MVSARRSASTAVRVRKATIRDLDQYAKNFQSVAHEGRYIFTEEVTEERKKSMGRVFKDKECLTIVAEVKERGKWKAVGNLALTRYGDAEKAKHVRVLSMLLVKGYRGRGIGTRMMAYALEWAKAKKGVEKVYLGVFSNNDRAFRLYERFGFKVEGVRKKHYYIFGKPEDEIDMALFVK
jgi:RimJ/RimL family protein N-acetyltransferase